MGEREKKEERIERKEERGERREKRGEKREERGERREERGKSRMRSEKRVDKIRGKVEIRERVNLLRSPRGHVIARTCSLGIYE